MDAAAVSSGCDVRLQGDGVTLAATRWGSADAPTVLLLPGGGQTRGSWTTTAERLAAEGWGPASVDLRGHGDSDWCPDGDYSGAAIARDLRCVLQQVGDAVVVGASIGGIAGLFAAADDRAVRALVLVDVATRHDPAGVDRIRRFMTAHPDGFESPDEAADALASYEPRRRRPRSERLTRNLRLRPDGRWVWHWDPTFMWPGWRAGNTDDTRPVTDREALRRAAARVTVPTLLVRGRRSDLVTPEAARELLELVPHAEHVDVAGAGHMVVGDDNDRFGDALVAFLERLRRA